MLGPKLLFVKTREVLGTKLREVVQPVSGCTSNSTAPILPVPFQGILAFSTAGLAIVADREHRNVEQVPVCSFGLLAHECSL